MNPLTYIRRKVAEAVAQGFADGIAAATQESEENESTDLKQLVSLATPAMILSPKKEEKKKRE